MRLERLDVLCSKRWLVICVGFPVLVYGPFRRNLLLSLFLSLVKEKSDFFFFYQLKICLPVLGEIGSDNVSIQETREH